MMRKKITTVAKYIISLWNIGLFAAAWFLYYNSRTFDAHWELGGLGICGAFVIIYSWFCSTYHVYRLASTNVSELIFSQIVAFGVADLILYLASCFSVHNFVNVMPGVVAVALQIAGTSILTIFFKRYLSAHLVPKNTIIIYGNDVEIEEVKLFSKKLHERYPFIFKIEKFSEETEDVATFCNLVGEYDIVILYEISHGLRGILMKICTELKKTFYFTPRIEDILCQGSEEKNLTNTPLLKYKSNYYGRDGYFGKRVCDIVLSIFLLFLFSPIMLITALCIKVEDKGPVFYKQKRCTKDGRVFNIIKFRSMIVDAEKEGVTLSVKNDERITKVGRIIRACRIDELPQFINVLKNDMSFVGPRPERPEIIAEYMESLPEFQYRCRVKGGMTGYAQVCGKYNSTPYDKLRYDLMYIENQSLYLDAKIIILTFRTIFQKGSTEGVEKNET